MQVESRGLKLPASKTPAPEWLEAIYAERFSAVKPGAEVPAIAVSFRRYASASAKIKVERGQLEVRISDTLAAAPSEVHHALADILVSKLYRRPVSADSSSLYRRYLRRPEVQRHLDMVRSIRGRKQVTGPQGSHYDLIELFDALNFKYFFGLMARPSLGWSRRVSKTLMGHYDPTHNAIVLSPLLDDARVPRLVVEYVMYHEMLHMRHPVEHRATRRCVHTRAFKQDERRFEGFEEAKRLLKNLPMFQGID